MFPSDIVKALSLKSDSEIRMSPLEKPALILLTPGLVVLQDIERIMVALVKLSVS